MNISNLAHSVSLPQIHRQWPVTVSQVCVMVITSQFPCMFVQANTGLLVPSPI